MKDESYYRCLDVLDRINSEAISKYGSGYAFSKALGLSQSFWNVHYSNVIFPRLSNINKYAQIFDVSVCYLLTGKNRDSYVPVVVSCDRLYKEYKTHKLSVDDCRKYAPIMFQVKRGHEVNLGTLFDFEDMFKISAYDLVFKKPLGE
jgi:hypothetical protein